MPGMGTLARRGLTPLFVLLVVAPPRVCTCEHDHAPASHAAHDDGDDGPAPCPHGPVPANDPDCPCVEPTPVKAVITANVSSHLPTAPRPEFVVPEPGRPVDLDRLAIDP